MNPRAPAAGGPAIEVVGVQKCFGANRALDGVDLAVHPGEVVALLGPNGAGKSTLIRVLATLVLPDAGAVRIHGTDALASPVEARARSGLVLGEERSFFWRLTGRQNLEFFAALHGMARTEAVGAARQALAAVQLGEAADSRVDRYSTGMRARLGIARALLGQPAVLLLDEPTRSLDPIVSIAIRRLVLDLTVERSCAVLFATHDLHEAAEIASRVVILARGRVAGRAEHPADAAALEQALLAATA